MENLYERAVAVWVSRKTKLDPDKISNVDFTMIYGGYCETCGYETTGLTFKYNGRYQEYELGTTSAAQLFEECATIVDELRAE